MQAARLTGARQCSASYDKKAIKYVTQYHGTYGIQDNVVGQNGTICTTRYCKPTHQELQNE